MKQSEWKKDKARHILVRGKMKATINKTRRYGKVRYWIVCSELVEGAWRHLFTFRPRDTLQEAKAAVEEHRLFCKDKKETAPKPAVPTYKSEPIEDAWWLK